MWIRGDRRQAKANNAPCATVKPAVNVKTANVRTLDPVRRQSMGTKLKRRHVETMRLSEFSGIIHAVRHASADSVDTYGQLFPRIVREERQNAPARRWKYRYAIPSVRPETKEAQERAQEPRNACCADSDKTVGRVLLGGIPPLSGCRKDFE